MWKKILVVGGVSTAILGAGTAALATTGNGVPSTKPAASSAHRANPLLSALHATWVVKGATGDVTHDAIRGTVSAVSPSSITVKASDGVSQTYAVGPATVLHTKADGKAKGATGRIATVQKGDTVGVLGTGTGSLSATRVLDRTR